MARVKYIKIPRLTAEYYLQMERAFSNQKIGMSWEEFCKRYSEEVRWMHRDVLVHSLESQ